MFEKSFGIGCVIFQLRDQIRRQVGLDFNSENIHSKFKRGGRNNLAPYTSIVLLSGKSNSSDHNLEIVYIICSVD